MNAHFTLFNILVEEHLHSLCTSYHFCPYNDPFACTPNMYIGLKRDIQVARNNKNNNNGSSSNNNNNNNNENTAGAL